MGSGEVAIVALSTMISLKVTFSDGLGGKRLIVPFVIFSIVGHLLLCIKLLQEAKWKGKATLNIVEKALGREILRNFAT